MYTCYNSLIVASAVDTRIRQELTLTARVELAANALNLTALRLTRTSVQTLGRSAQTAAVVVLKNKKFKNYHFTFCFSLFF
jgi:hypothetical protein